MSPNGYSNIRPNSAISESIIRLRIHKALIEKYDAWPFIIKAVSMFLGEEPVLEDRVLSIGPDIEVQLDQFNDLC